MRKSLLVVLMCLMMIVSAYAEEKKIWKVATLEWQPYVGSDIPNNGRTVEKLKALLDKKNITLELDFLPWERAKMMAKKKEYVGYFPACIEEIDKGFVNVGIVDWSSLAIMSKINTVLKYNTIEELFQNNKVGLVKSYDYPTDITSLVAKYKTNVVMPISDQLLTRMLSIGRFDVAITDPEVMKWYAEKEKLGSIKIDKLLEKKELVFAMRDGEDNVANIEIMKELLKG